LRQQGAKRRYASRQARGEWDSDWQTERRSTRRKNDRQAAAWQVDLKRKHKPNVDSIWSTTGLCGITFVGCGTQTLVRYSSARGADRNRCADGKGGRDAWERSAHERTLVAAATLLTVLDTKVCVRRAGRSGTTEGSTILIGHVASSEASIIEDRVGRQGETALVR
jgi:hypothetical protein